MRCKSIEWSECCARSWVEPSYSGYSGIAKGVPAIRDLRDSVLEDSVASLEGHRQKLIECRRLVKDSVAIENFVP